MKRPCYLPATHARVQCLGELNLTYVLIYLDDVIIFSRTPEEHLIRLQAVLERFLEHGLKLKLSKCHFFWMEIDYLGHKVSKDRMIPGTDNIKSIAEMAPLTTVMEVRHFLGATGFYCHFIKGYANMANHWVTCCWVITSSWKERKWILALRLFLPTRIWKWSAWLHLYSPLLTLKNLSC